MLKQGWPPLHSLCERVTLMPAKKRRGTGAIPFPGAGYAYEASSRRMENYRDWPVQMMVVRADRSHVALDQRAMYELTNLLLVAIEAMLASLEILDDEPLEITKMVEDKPGHLPNDTLLRDLFPVQKLEQRFALDAAEPRAGVPSWHGNVPGRAAGGITATVGDITKNVLRVA